MDISDLRRRKKALKLTNQDISDLTDIPVSTVNKVLGGVTKSPRYDTLLAIEDAIGKKEKDSNQISRYDYGVNLDNPMMVRESNNYAMDTRTYTEEDLDNLPEGNFAELIDGILYFKGSPSLTHERIISRLSLNIMNYIQEHGGKCEVFSSHYAMRLQTGENEANVFLPDIMTVCRPDILKDEYCAGPADWVIEVASPGNSKNDYQKKVYHYRRGGVQEYWIIDPQKRIVTVFDYESEKIARQEGITIYSYEEVIPVQVLSGMEVCMKGMGF